MIAFLLKDNNIGSNYKCGLCTCGINSLCNYSYQ